MILAAPHWSARRRGPLFSGSTDRFAELFPPDEDPETVIVDFMRSRDCHPLLNCAGQLMVDRDDDPDYGLTVDYSVRTVMFGAER